MVKIGAMTYSYSTMIGQSANHPRRRRSGRSRSSDCSTSSIMELSFAVVLILQSVALVFQNGNGGGAYAYHVHPPNSFYPPPGFHGRGRGRRYDGGDNEDDYNDGNSNNNNNNNNHRHHHHRQEDGWFYAPHQFPHPDDPYFHHYHDDLPPPPPPFPPPPPPYYRHPPRFMEPPPPHVAMYDTTPELSQSQLLTTRRNNNNNDDDDEDSHYYMEHNTQTKTETTTVSTPPPVQSIWKTSAPVLVPSSTLQTFAFDTPTVERVQVLLKTGHRHGRSRSIPLQARIDVWHGPDSTPQNLAIYLEDDEEDDDDDDLVFADEARRSIHDDDDDDNDEEEEEDTTNFSAIIETPQGYNTIAVRNTAPNFDLLACVEGEECPTDIATNNNGIPHRHMNGDPSGYYYEQTYGIPRSEAQRKNQFQHSSTRHARQQEHTSTTTNSSPLQSVIERLMATSTPQLIEGTRSAATVSAMDVPVRPDIHTVRLAQNVASVQVLLRTDYMRPLQARVELILKERRSTNHKDPGRVIKRTIVEVFSEDGMHRPFFAVLETPKPRKRKRPRPEDEEKRYTISLRVINLSGAEFPIFASVEPYIIDTNHEKVSAEGAKNKGDNINNDNGHGSFEGRNEDREEPENVWNSAGYTQDDGHQDNDNDISEEDWWEQSMENSHFGGGSHYDMSTNSTILDAEIL